jgi:Skp family chaperone for outer membrane proteins
MNRNLVLVSAVGVGLMTAAGMAQATGSPAPATPAAPAPASPAATAPPAAAAPNVPQVIPAKIALVAFEQAVFTTNEGQKAVLEVQKKFEPQKSKIDALGQEIDGLKKQLDSLPATTTAADRASRQRAIDTKDKELQHEAEDAQTAYNADLQEAYAKVAQKVSVTLKNYVAQNGYTLLLDVSNQASAVMWALPSTDVTDAVIQAYNTASGVAAPPPAAPSATRPSGGSIAPKPAAPRSTTPKPAPPK